MGLFPVPGAALRPPQVGDDLRQRVKPAPEDPGILGGGNIDQRPVVEPVIPVQGVKGHPAHPFPPFHPQGGSDGDGVFVGKNLHQRQLHIGGDHPIVHLSDNQMKARIDPGSLQGGPVQQGETLHRIDAQAGKGRVEEAAAPFTSIRTPRSGPSARSSRTDRSATMG